MRDLKNKIDDLEISEKELNEDIFNYQDEIFNIENDIKNNKKKYRKNLFLDISGILLSILLLYFSLNITPINVFILYPSILVFIGFFMWLIFIIGNFDERNSNYKYKIKKIKEKIVDSENSIEECTEELEKLKEEYSEYKLTQDYIDERNLSYSQNINDFSINEKIKNKKGDNCIITNKTSNSIEVFIEKDLNFYNNEFECEDCGKVSFLDKNKKFKCSNDKCKSKNYKSVKKNYSGVDCKQYYTMQSFNKEFKKI